MMQPGWIFQGSPYLITYPEILQQGLFGFIYRIDNRLNERIYYGKRCFHTTRKKRGRGFNYRGTWQSDWMQYWGSSDELKTDIIKYGGDQFIRTILTVHRSKHALTYAEEEILFLNNVLRAKLPNGMYKYYNANIGARYFRNTWDDK